MSAEHDRTPSGWRSAGLREIQTRFSLASAEWRTFGGGPMNPLTRLLNFTARWRLFALLAFAGSLVAQATPAQVLIRVPRGHPVPSTLAPLLAKWRQSGQVENVLLLTGGRAEKPGAQPLFEALAVLQFADENACAMWQKQAAAALPSGLIVRRADVLIHGGVLLRGSKQPVFLVNTYTPTVAPAQYNDFVQGYIKPLYAAMTRTRNLVSYTMYLERGATGRVNSFSILEYRDGAALTAMGPLKRQIREHLTAGTPTYAHYDPIKSSLRGDDGGTFATCADLPPPAHE